MNEDCDYMLVSKALWFSICSLFVVQVALTRPIPGGFGCVHVKSMWRAKKGRAHWLRNSLGATGGLRGASPCTKKCSKSALPARWFAFSIFSPLPLKHSESATAIVR